MIKRQAYGYPGARLPSLRFDARLFGGAPLPFAVARDMLDLGEGLSLPRLSIPLAGGRVLEVLHTPGHSPCSVSFRIGRMLLVGDLPAGATPGLAGLAGWSQPALLHSLAAVTRLIEREHVALCGVGHGGMVEGPAMVRALRATRRTAEGLSGVADLDDARIAALKAFALDLLAESAVLFAALAAQIHAVQFRLTLLEDEAAAEEVLRSLDIEALDHAVADLQAFAQRFRDGAEPDLGMVLKASATLQKLERLLRGGLASGAVRPTLARRAASLLGHFLAAVRGLSFPAPEAAVGIGGLAAEVVRDVQAGAQADAAHAMEAAEDAEAFRRFVIGRLAAAGTPRDITLEVAGGLHDARVDAERFQDVLITLLEVLGRGGTRALRVRVAEQGGEVVLGIAGIPAIAPADVPDRRRALLERLLGESGASLGLSGGQVTLRLPLAA